MKKIIFGSVAALCAVMGLSSFKASKPLVTVYWFKVNSGQGLSTGLHSVNNSQVTFFSMGAIPTKSSTGCSGSTKDCLVGFTALQLTSGQQHLITNAITTVQPMRTVGYTRSTN